MLITVVAGWGMDMPRPERALDPNRDSIARFASELRALRKVAGQPGYRQLARRAHYSATTLADAAAGRRLPSLAVTLAYVEACGGDLRQWQRRWQAIAAEPASTGEDAAVVAEQPYRGLAAYQPEDAPWFFGRSQATEDLRRRVSSGRFLAVFGPSGCGKSSLLRAGLIASVAERYRTLLITPGAHPVAELALALAGPLGIPAGTVRNDLATAEDNLGLLARQLLGAEPDSEPEAELLIVVDQFEEIFTLCPDTQERAAFIAALLAATETAQSRTRVVLGVRADFYLHCAQHPRLVTALADHQLLIGAMTGAELREAIAGPDVIAARRSPSLRRTRTTEKSLQPRRMPASRSRR